MQYLKTLAARFALVLALLVPVLAPTAPANAAAMSDYLENKVIDWLLRGQTYSPTHMFVALATTTGSDTACGTEVSGSAYARVDVGVPALALWAGTQSAGSTTASSGTGGTSSNNSTITFPTPTGSWGTVTEVCVFDASTAGNLLWRVGLTVSKTIASGDVVDFPAASLTFQIDN